MASCAAVANRRRGRFANRPRLAKLPTQQPGVNLRARQSNVATYFDSAHTFLRLYHLLVGVDLVTCSRVSQRAVPGPVLSRDSKVLRFRHGRQRSLWINYVHGSEILSLRQN